MEVMIIIFAWVLVGGAVGAVIGKARGHETQGMILGSLLGVIGWAIAAMANDDRPKCESCLGPVPAAARKCMHCGEDLEAQRAARGERLRAEARTRAAAGGSAGLARKMREGN